MPLVPILDLTEIALFKKFPCKLRASRSHYRLVDGAAASRRSRKLFGFPGRISPLKSASRQEIKH